MSWAMPWTLHSFGPIVDGSLMGIISSLDSLAVAFALGCSGKEVPFWVNLQIAIAASLVMVIAMAFGDVMSKIFPSWSLDIIPGLVFVVLGVVAASEYIVELMQAEHPHEQGEKVPLNPMADDLDQKELVPESFRTETSTILPARKKATQSVMDALMALDRLDFSDPRTTIPLTVGLCLNNFGGGVAAGLADMNILYICGVSAITSVLFFHFGLVSGHVTRTIASKAHIRTSHVSLVSGLLLLVLGVLQLVPGEWSEYV